MSIQIIAVAAVFFIILTGLGVIVSVGKADSLIFGKINKGKYKDDIDGKRRFMCRSLFGFSFCAFLCLIGQLLSIGWLYEFGLYLFCGIVIIIIAKRGKKSKAIKK